MVNSKENCEAWFGWTNDNIIRMQSSSGGVFSELAGYVLEKKGVVFGAYFDPQLKEVRHVSSDNVSIENMRRSKYVESNMSDTIPLIKSALQSGRLVLFCGTPCQCAGVRKFFGHSDELILCDFFCHGVPSPRVFKDFLELMEKKEHTEILDYRFRTKTYGWNQYGLEVLYKNGKCDKTVGRCEFFFTATMLDNKFLRKSCYTCDKAMYHESDFTVGDFWGINKVKMIENDNKGVSIILANTTSARKIMIKLQKKMTLYPLEKHYIDYAFKVKTADQMIQKRNELFEEYNRIGIESFIKKYYQWKLFVSKIKFKIMKRKLQMREL